MKAIHSISNNFGSPNADFFYHSDERIAVLTGRIPIDTANEDYVAAESLQLNFPADIFPFERSEVAFAYLCAVNEGERIYSVPVRARIVSKSRIEVEKLDAYDTNSHDVELYFNSGFIIQGNEVLLQPTASQKLTFKKEGSYGYLYPYQCFNRIEEDWGFISVVFDYLSINAKSDTIVSITGFPTDAECELLAFQASSSNYSGPGCRVSKGRFENGQLIVHNEDDYSVGGTYAYIHLFFTRVKQKYTVTFMRDGEVVGTEAYVEGQTIVYPELPDGYAWDSSPEFMPANDLTIDSSSTGEPSEE